MELCKSLMAVAFDFEVSFLSLKTKNHCPQCCGISSLNTVCFSCWVCTIIVLIISGFLPIQSTTVSDDKNDQTFTQKEATMKGHSGLSLYTVLALQCHHPISKHGSLSFAHRVLTDRAKCSDRNMEMENPSPVYKNRSSSAVLG